MNTKKLNVKAASYPQTSHSEQLSVDIFHRLLDRRSIRGNASVMDKVPNTDGVMTMIDGEQVPIGLFELQLKTLAKRYLKTPKFQCELSLLAYALDSILPIFLVVVDQINERAYWLHLNKTLVSSISPKSTAKSILLTLDTTQIIDGKDLNYISIWKDVIKQVQNKVHNFDNIESQKDAFQKLLAGTNPRLVPAFSINEFAIREIHLFLDLLNNKFDRELKTIKEILYYNYWKLGIGLIDYRSNGISFFILPLPLSSNSPLILEVVDKQRHFVDEIFAKDKALIMMMNGQENPIRENPRKLAMKLLDKEVFNVVGKIDFVVDNAFLAMEYLYSFARAFHSILGLTADPDEIDLDRLDRIIYVLLPVAREVERGPSTGKIIHLIDHLQINRPTEYATKLDRAEKALADGLTPNPKLKLGSRLFDMDIVKYYLNLLKSIEVRKVKSTLLPLKDHKNGGLFVWDNWILTNLYDNIKVILSVFPDIYQKIVDERFPLLKTKLDLFREDSVVVYIFVPSYQDDKPRLLYFRFCIENNQPLRELFLFHADSPDCPDLINNERFSNIWQETFIFKGETHKLRQTGEYPLEFLFTKSPTYTLINDMLGLRFSEYFKANGLKNSNYRAFSANSY